MTCVSNLPAGVNKSCTAPLGKISNFILQNYNDSMSLEDLTKEVEWANRINKDSDYDPLAMWIPPGLHNTEDTGTGPSEQETPNGQKYQSRQNPPSMIAYAEVAPCDFYHMSKILKGGLFRVWLVSGNTMLGTSIIKTDYTNEQDDTIYRGYAARVYAEPTKLPTDDENSTVYRVYFYFTNVDEFRNTKVLDQEWNPTMKLLEAMPVGVNINLDGQVSASIKIYAAERCGDVKADLTDADFITTVNGVTKAFDTVSYDSATKLYTCTFTVPPTEGDAIKTYVKVLDTTNSEIVLYKSGPITFNYRA